MNMLEYYKSKPKDFMVKKHSTKDLYIVKYLHSGIDWSQPYALDARGIVLDGSGNVISRPYRKFFNYMELANREDLSDEIKKMSAWEDNERFAVFDKLDGSLAVISQYDGELLYSSSGNIEGVYPDKFKNWIESNLWDSQIEKLEEFTKIFTLVFEYISPIDRIVLNYEEEQMVLHGVINTQTGEEILHVNVLEEIANVIGVELAEYYDYMTLEELEEIKKHSLGEDKLIEGFVILFNNGKRLKIKTQEYLDIHGKSTIGFGKIDSKAKVKIYIDMIENDEIDDFIALYQQREDEYTVKFLNDVYAIHRNFMAMVAEAERVNKEEGFSKRDWAINNGSDGHFNKLVLNIDKEHKIERIKDNYILEMVEERMGYTNGNV